MNVNISSTLASQPDFVLLSPSLNSSPSSLLSVFQTCKSLFQVGALHRLWAVHSAPNGSFSRCLISSLKLSLPSSTLAHLHPSTPIFCPSFSFIALFDIFPSSWNLIFCVLSSLHLILYCSQHWTVSLQQSVQQRVTSWWYRLNEWIGWNLWLQTADTYGGLTQNYVLGRPPILPHPTTVQESTIFSLRNAYKAVCLLFDTNTVRW